MNVIDSDGVTMEWRCSENSGGCARERSGMLCMSGADGEGLCAA
jgi:hypothetical protein